MAVMCGSTQERRGIKHQAPRHAPGLRRIADKLGNSRRRAVLDRSEGLRTFLPADAPNAHALASGRRCSWSSICCIRMSVDLRGLSLSERKRDLHRCAANRACLSSNRSRRRLARVQELRAGPGLRAGMKAAPACAREGVAGPVSC
jgi:hypothetical protein